MCCQGCTTREIGCHSKCSEYAVYKANLAIIAENRQKYLLNPKYELKRTNPYISQAYKALFADKSSHERGKRK